MTTLADLVLKKYDTITVNPIKIIEYYMEGDGFSAPLPEESQEARLKKIANYIVHLKINHKPPVATRLRHDGSE